jgi:hypothetical protein
MKAEDRCCCNCLHLEQSAHDAPCDTCDEEHSRWREAEAEPTRVDTQVIAMGSAQQQPNAVKLLY